MKRAELFFSLLFGVLGLVFGCGILFSQNPLPYLILCDKAGDTCLIQQPTDKTEISIEQIDTVFLDFYNCGYRRGKRPFIHFKLKDGTAYAYPGGKLPMAMTLGCQYPLPFGNNILDHTKEMKKFLDTPDIKELKIEQEYTGIDYAMGIIFLIIGLLSFCIFFIQCFKKNS